MTQKQFTGVVTSTKRDKSITVVVTSRETHPLYRKQYTINRSYQAHDENNEAGEGDRVTIEACRPVSKTKAFKLLRIDEKSKGSIQLKEEVNAEVEDKADFDHADKSEEVK